MTERWPAHGFTAVDRQADPRAWVRCVDLIQREPFYADYKARVTALLALAPGDDYLDLGGGAGDDALRRAAATGARPTLLDSSATMAVEDRRRGLARAVVGDAAALPFADGSFDACSADRVFQHLADPDAALSELARVTRPGGRLVIVDPDYDTQVVECADQDLARAMRRFRADHALRNGTLAHRMAGRFAAVGLRDIQVEARTLVVRDPAAVDNVMGLRTWAESAHAHGLISAEEAARWPALLDAAVAAGGFLYAVTFFLTGGVKAS
jgi:SAM-dependent methyltransferase